MLLNKILYDHCRASSICFECLTYESVAIHYQILILIWDEQDAIL